MPRSGTCNRSLPVSGALGRVRARTSAPLREERASTPRVELGARVRLDYGELPAPSVRRRLEVVTYLGEVVTYLGEPVTVWVTL
jgi:hypothetical protein